MKLKDGSEVGDPRLGRLIQFDERSRSYPIRQLVAGKSHRSYTWRVDTWLNQGSEGSCVGHAWAHELAARPAVIPVGRHIAIAVYYAAQERDPWPGGSYPGAQPFYEGTSVLAGAQVCLELNYFAEYRWAFGVDDLLLAIGYAGPAVLGIAWYEDMANPDPEGQIRPQGDVLGGHAILAYKIQVKQRRVWLWNSWGRNWGIDGSCWLSWDDLERLLHEDGEACIPVKRTRPQEAR